MSGWLLATFLLAQVAPAAPRARWAHAMTYDEAHERVLMFGGTARNAQPLRDLWAWDGHAWALLADAADGPSARDAAMLVYDSRRKRTLLHGGRAADTPLTDTWEWDGARWTRLDVAGPSARLHCVAAYDGERGVVTLFGGISPGEVFLTDTWTFDGERWSQVDAVGPTSLAPDGMAFDAARRTLALVGSDVSSAQPGKPLECHVFEWSGDSWKLDPTSSLPLDPIQPVAPADPREGLLVLDGTGEAGSCVTWRWNWTGWVRASAAGPSARSGHALATDTLRQRIVLFGGGEGRERMGDTWEWDGSSWLRADAGERVR